MSNLRIGTCSWKYPSWEGLVYSRARNINYLEEYSKRYSTVEVDQWFWSLFKKGKIRLPEIEVVAEYGSSVPANFRFTVKVPNSITLTHYYKKKTSDPLEENPHFLSLSLFEEFLSRLGPIKDLLGVLIFQFEYLNRQKMRSQKRLLHRLEAFFSQVPDSYRYAIELRNPHYLNEPYFEFLSRKGLSHTFLQGYWMPDITKIFEERGGLLKDQKRVLIRLHGTGRDEIEKAAGKKWDRIIAPKDAELLNIAKMTRSLLDQGKDVYVNVNNHYEGSAPLTIEKLEKTKLFS